MKQNTALWQFSGFCLTSLAGTILHFLYDWSGENALISLISGVNESTWEHMKLLFFPLFVFAIIQSRFFKDYRWFWHVKFCGTVAGLLVIPVLFYTWNGAFGRSPDWFNITIFFIATATTFAVEMRLFAKQHGLSRHLALGLLCLIGVLFIVFTLAPPHLPLFQDPLTKQYGR